MSGVHAPVIQTLPPCAFLPRLPEEPPITAFPSPEGFCALFYKGGERKEKERNVPVEEKRVKRRGQGGSVEDGQGVPAGYSDLEPS